MNELPKEFIALMEMGRKYMDEQRERENRIEFKANLSIEEVQEVSNLLRRLREK